MIMDKLTVLAAPEDGSISTTRAVCLAQADLKAPTDGIAPYKGLWLTVLAYDGVEDFVVTLEHCDTKDGTYEPLTTYPAVTAEIGEVIVKAPVPFGAKNWLRLSFSAATRCNALFTAGVDKGVLTND